MHEQNFHKAMISLNKILTAAWGAYGVYANLRSISEEEKYGFLLYLKMIFILINYEFCMLDRISFKKPRN